MKLQSSHTFEHGLADVEDAMTDPAFYEQLELPDVTKPELLGREVDGPSITVRLHYVFTGHVDAIVHRVLGNDDIAWTQTLAFDTGAGRGTLTIEPSVLAGQVRCSADIVLTGDSTRCTRTLEGEFKVGVPLLGGRAENAIGPGIQRRLDIEAAALADWVARLGG